MEQPRSWTKSILIALVTVYLPIAVPFAVGPLTECSHCVANYLRMSPIVPGCAIGLRFPGFGLLFYLVTGATTLALLAGCLTMARRLPIRALLMTQLLVMLLLTLEALALAVLLRA